MNKCKSKIKKMILKNENFINKIKTGKLIPVFIIIKYIISASYNNIAE